MRIEEIELFRVAMPLKVPFRSAIGEERVIETLFVRLQWGEYAGWGESTPQARPFYSGEWATGAFALLRDCLAPMAFGFVMIEQPLGYDDLVDHASLQDRLKTPICLVSSLRCCSSRTTLQS
jgi:L-alanine-DL-glutamate epimerase-like enolase superfamily enzyme